MNIRHQQTDVHKSITKQDRNNINDPQKKHRLGTVSKNILLKSFDLTDIGSVKSMRSCLVAYVRGGYDTFAKCRNLKSEWLLSISVRKECLPRKFMKATWKPFGRSLCLIADEKWTAECKMERER